MDLTFQTEQSKDNSWLSELKKEVSEEIPSNVYTREQEHIGEGAFGRVYKAIEIATNNTVAIKVINILHEEISEEMLLSELRILRHSNSFINECFSFVI